MTWRRLGDIVMGYFTTPTQWFGSFDPRKTIFIIPAGIERIIGRDKNRFWPVLTAR
jgi:hypothetical protein